MTIHKEHFEAWLFGQPDNREWVYTSPTSCVICCFLREQCRIEQALVNPESWFLSSADVPDRPQIFHEWLLAFSRRIVCLVASKQGAGMDFTAAQAKAEWRKLWPESEPQLIQRQAIDLAIQNGKAR